MAEDKTIKEVFDTFTEEEKNVAYAIIGKALEDAKNDTDKGDSEMKHNVFDKNEEGTEMKGSAISVADLISEAKRTGGSLKDAYLRHGDDDPWVDPRGNFATNNMILDDAGNPVTYGIANVNYLFPEAKSLNTPPDFIQRENAWVKTVMGGVHHTPFSRIKSMFANITGEEARARGYIKGNQKIEEVFPVLKRVTTPTTIYKKQKMDRDDIIDITDFDVIAWLKAEMRVMLDEEIARAILIGDGRPDGYDDKISETCIRPIWTDADLYTIKADFAIASNATEDEIAKAEIRKIIKSRKDYKGSGNLTLFTTEDELTNMLLLEDNTGRVIYDTEDKLRTALRVRRIVTVPLMEGLTRTITLQGGGSRTLTLRGILVDLADYNVGADKGGAVSLFDDFDIDVNQFKYLIETRCSGALIKPYSAIAVETYVAS